jgi:hypothetical protein
MESKLGHEGGKTGQHRLRRIDVVVRASAAWPDLLARAESEDYERDKANAAQDCEYRLSFHGL